MRGKRTAKRLAAGAQVQDRARTSRLFESAQHELDVIAKRGAAPGPFEGIGSPFRPPARLSGPVAAGAGGGRPGTKPYQAALPTFNNLVPLTRGVV